MFKAAKMPQYDVTVVADAKKGELKKLNISDYVNPMLANIPVVKDQVKDKQIKVDGNFETLNLKGRFTNSLYSLNSFDFVGIDKKFKLLALEKFTLKAELNLQRLKLTLPITRVKFLRFFRKILDLKFCQ